MTSASPKLLRAIPNAATEIAVTTSMPRGVGAPDQAWLVLRGSVEVFRVQERRRFLCEIPAGQVVFGFDQSPGARQHLVAVGSSDARVLATDRRSLEKLATKGREREDVARWMEDWLKAIGGVLSLDGRPQRSRDLFGGTGFTLEAGESLNVRRSIVWVRAKARGVMLAGRAELELQPGVFVPVVQGTWLTSTSKTELELADTRVWLESDPTWAGLDEAHRLIGRAAAIAEHEELNRERELAVRRKEADRTRFESALAGLGETFADTDVGTPAGDVLFEACRAIGEAQGISFASPRAFTGAAESHTPLERIAIASRVRAREVVLRGAWWRDDLGPLLAFRGEARSPVALIPDVGRARYLIEDPAAGSRGTLTDELAGELDPVAISFQRPLPEDVKLGAKQLLIFLARGSRRELALLLATGLAVGIASSLLAVGTGILFDHVVPAADRGMLFQLAFAMLVVAIASSMFGLARGFAVLRIEERWGAQLETGIWDRLLRLPPAFFRRFSAAELAMRAHGVESLRRALSGQMLETILAGAFSASNVAVMIYIDPALAAVGCALVAAAVFIASTAGLFRLRHARAKAQHSGRVSSFLFQAFHGIAKLRAAAAESRVFAAWAALFRELQSSEHSGRRVEHRLAIFTGVQTLASSAVIFAFVLHASHGIAPGQYLAFSAAFSSFSISAIAMVHASLVFFDAMPHWERTKPILEAALEDRGGRPAPGVLTGEIELNHVTFRYGDRGALVLDDINISIKPRELIAIVGRSGSGKSTLVRLLVGFEQPTAGAVYYGGENLAGLDPEAVRRQLGVVLQDAELYEGTVLENVIGRKDLGVERAWEALELAGLAADVRKMPLGLQSIIGNSGSGLSGGQRQRLIIARALVRRPKILILDEATSALDNAMQAGVANALSRLDATRIVIAHRLSTVLGADRIYVLDGGRIVQEGTYESLMAAPGLFRELARDQIS